MADHRKAPNPAAVALGKRRWAGKTAAEISEATRAAANARWHAQRVRETGLLRRKRRGKAQPEATA